MASVSWAKEICLRLRRGRAKEDTSSVLVWIAVRLLLSGRGETRCSSTATRGNSEVKVVCKEERSDAGDGGRSGVPARPVTSSEGLSPSLFSLVLSEKSAESDESELDSPKHELGLSSWDAGSESSGAEGLPEVVALDEVPVTL